MCWIVFLSKKALIECTINGTGLHFIFVSTEYCPKEILVGNMLEIKTPKSQSGAHINLYCGLIGAEHIKLGAR